MCIRSVTIKFLQPPQAIRKDKKKKKKTKKELDQAKTI